jgi:hypothetical protein
MGSPGGADPSAAAVRRPPVRLRPLGVGETLDAGLKLFRNRPREMVLATLVPTIPAVIVFVLVQMSTGDPQAVFGTDEATGVNTVDGGNFVLYIGGTVVNTIVLLLANNLALAGTMRISIGTYLGEEISWRDSLRFAVSRWKPLTALVLISFVATLASIVACFLPSIWLTGIWAVAVPALLVEGTGPVRSLGRSNELVRGRFWPVLGTVVLAGLLASVLQGILLAPAIVLQLVQASIVVTAILTGIGQLIGSALTLPYTAAVTAVIYFDLRVRKEGYDLELLAQGVGVDPPPPDPSDAPPPGPVAPAGGWGAPAGSGPAAPGGWTSPGGWTPGPGPSAPPGGWTPGPGPGPGAGG